MCALDFSSSTSDECPSTTSTPFKPTKPTLLVLLNVYVIVTAHFEMVHAINDPPSSMLPQTTPTHDVLSAAAISQLASRLALLPELALPASYLRTTPEPTHNDKKAYIASLLEQQPALFLERHVRDLTLSEREYFEPLRADYEVNHWLKTVEDQSKPPHASTYRNRRLAYMQTGAACVG